MTSFISSLTTGLSADALWGSVSGLAPIIIVSVLFGLAVYFLRRVLKNMRKAKGGV